MKGIYGYYDKEKKYFAYIGKDANIGIEKRHKEHCHYNSRKNDQQINRVLRNNPHRYEYFILEHGNFTDEELISLEKFYIDFFKTYHYDYPERSVFNFTRGGDGVSGHKHSEETKRKIGKTKSGENNPSAGTGNSGILYVYKHKDKRCKQGYTWRYRKTINGKQYEKESVNLRKLKNNILNDNQEWIIIDKEKAKQSYNESDSNNISR